MKLKTGMKVRMLPDSSRALNIPTTEIGIVQNRSSISREIWKVKFEKYTYDMGEWEVVSANCRYGMI